MGRTAEDAFLAVIAREMGASGLIGEYRPTAKNAVARDLYPRLGFRLLRQEADAGLWEWKLAEASLMVPAWFEIELASSALVSAAV